MSAAPDLESLLRPDVVLRPAGDGLWSSVAPGDAGAPYDAHARIYDQVIGSPLYNRVIWGTRSSDYAHFAAEAVADGGGPLLDAGCGTAVFTGDVYRASSRPVVLADRSVGMLRKASTRVGGAARASLLQTDLLALPTRPASFDTVGCFAMLHVLDEPWLALSALSRQVRAGGRLYASMLVLGRGGLSDRYLRLLRSRGELGPLRTAGELEVAARELFREVRVERFGAMAYLRASAPVTAA